MKKMAWSQIKNGRMTFTDFGTTPRGWKLIQNDSFRKSYVKGNVQVSVLTIYPNSTKTSFILSYNKGLYSPDKSRITEYPNRKVALTRLSKYIKTH